VGCGGCEISFCVCRGGVDRVCLGGAVKISFISTRNIVVFVTIYICTINLFLLFDNTTGMKHLKTVVVCVVQKVVTRVSDKRVSSVCQVAAPLPG